MPTCQSNQNFDQADACPEDDDLQSLEWLQNFDISQITNFLDSGVDASTKSEKSDSVNFASPIEDSTSVQKRKPLQCTFSCMIFRAIEESPHRALPLQSIYSWIENRYPYFAKGGSQWKNSVRHSLSLNQCFIRLRLGHEDVPDRSSINVGSASWWTVHPDFRSAYGKGVLAEGSAHVCLPRGICGPGVKKNAVTRLSTSEHELAVLANDIKAAATILALKEPLGASNRSRPARGRKRKKSMGSQYPKRKADHEYVVSHGVAEDHRYISENTKRNFTISSIIGSSKATDRDRDQSRGSEKQTADACVQVCASDFELEIKNKRFVKVQNAKIIAREARTCKK